MFKKIFLALAILVSCASAQDVIFLKNHYVWNPVTLLSRESATKFMLYMDVDKTQIPKDSLDDFGDGPVRVATRSCSKYIVMSGDTVNVYNETFNSNPAGWSSSVWLSDTLSYTGLVNNTSRSIYSPYIDYSNSRRDSIRFEIGILISDTTRILFIWEGPNGDQGEVDTTVLTTGYHIVAVTTPCLTTGNYPETSTKYIIELISQDTNGDANSYYKSIKVNYAKIDEISNADSIRTQARTISKDDLLEGHPYTWYAATLAPNGKYLKGEDSIIVKGLPAPEFEYVDDGIMGVRMAWFDNAINESGYIIYSDDTPIDTLDANTTEYCYTLNDITADSTVNLRVAAYTPYIQSYSDTISGTAIYAAGDSTLTDSTANISSTFNGVYINEGGNLTGWTETVESGNDVLIVGTGGNPDSLIKFSYGGTNDQAYIQRDFTADDEWWMRTYIYVPSSLNFGTSTTNAGVFSFFNTASLGLDLELRTSSGNPNSWRVYYNSTTLATTNTNGYTEDAWVEIIMHYNATPADGSEEVELWADGISIYSSSALTLTQKTINRFRIGANAWGANPDNGDYWNVDNWSISSDSTGMYKTVDTTWTYNYSDNPVTFDCAPLQITNYLPDINGEPILDVTGEAILIKED